MKQSKFTEVQIIKILPEQNAGKSVNDICREQLKQKRLSVNQQSFILF